MIEAEGIVVCKV